MDIIDRASASPHINKSKLATTAYSHCLSLSHSTYEITKNEVEQQLSFEKHVVECTAAVVCVALCNSDGRDSCLERTDGAAFGSTSASAWRYVLAFFLCMKDGGWNYEGDHCFELKVCVVEEEGRVYRFTRDFIVVRYQKVIHQRKR